MVVLIESQRDRNDRITKLEGTILELEQSLMIAARPFREKDNLAKFDCSFNLMEDVGSRIFAIPFDQNWIGYFEHV